MKGIKVAIIPPLATLFIHNSICHTFRLWGNNVNLLRDKFHETFMIFGANRITFSSIDHLYVTVLTGVHSFQPNRQKGPWHWKGWEPLS